MDLLTSFKAFLDNPLKFISDPANTTIEYQTKKAVTGGATKKEIETVLVGQGFIKGSPIITLANGIGKTAQFLANNIHIIFLIGIAIILFSYLAPVLRKR